MTPTPEPTDHGHADHEHDTPAVERTGVLADDPRAAPTVPERRWQALARLMAVESSTLAPLVRMSPLPEGVALTHRLPLDSVPLSALRAASPLRAGHVLTVALAVADALVCLDEHGLAHGGVSGDQVVVGPDGSVVLAGSGLAWRRPPGDADGPRVTDDIAELGELVRDLLGAGSSPSSLVLAALRAADPDPALRPSPLELTALLRRCGRADPLLDLLWGGSAREARAGVVVEPRPAARLRIDPRTAPGPVDDVPTSDGVAEGGDRREKVTRGALLEATARPQSSTPRRPGGPRRPAVRDRRRPRRRGGPWVIVLVSVLAALALGAVRVGALAMADGPVERTVSTPGARAVASPEATSAENADAASASMSGGARVTDAPTDRPATTAPGVDGTTTGAALDLDHGAVSTDPDWRGLLAAADAGRQRALATGDATALATWVDPDGSAWSADVALAERVTSLGASIVGGALVVLDVRPRHVTASDAVLLVQDRRDAYTVTTTAGASQVPSRAPRWWQVTLRSTTDADGVVAWRVRDVAPTAAPKG
jgi:hypothetical protein